VISVGFITCVPDVGMTPVLWGPCGRL
jgi:hypothetical protein